MYCTMGGDREHGARKEIKSGATRRLIPAIGHRGLREDTEITESADGARKSRAPACTPTPEPETVWSTLDIDDPITEATEATTPVNGPWHPDLWHSKGNARSATNISL